MAEEMRADLIQHRLDNLRRDFEALDGAHMEATDELARVWRLLEAGDALFRWIEREWPKVLVEAPTPIMQRIRRARDDLGEGE